MSGNFTRRSDVRNYGGIHIPFHERPGALWLILTQDADGQDVLTELFLPYGSCPRTWLAEQGIVLDEDALAELIR